MVFVPSRSGRLSGSGLNQQQQLQLSDHLHFIAGLVQHGHV
jgi:hypothetical protein